MYLVPDRIQSVEITFFSIHIIKKIVSCHSFSLYINIDICLIQLTFDLTFSVRRDLYAGNLVNTSMIVICLALLTNIRAENFLFSFSHLL